MMDLVRKINLESSNRGVKEDTAGALLLKDPSLEQQIDSKPDKINLIAFNNCVNQPYFGNAQNEKSKQ